jgi:hypothetical protein
MTYVNAFRIKQASLVQITEMIDSVIERRDSEQGSVPAQVDFANEIQADSRILMVNKDVRSTQRNLAKAFDCLQQRRQLLDHMVMLQTLNTPMTLRKCVPQRIWTILKFYRIF